MPLLGPHSMRDHMLGIPVKVITDSGAKLDAGRSDATRERDYELRWSFWVNARLELLRSRGHPDTVPRRCSDGKDNRSVRA